MATLQPRERVIIETIKSEIYEGNVANASPLSIELYDVIYQNSNVPFEGNLTFYKNEWRTVSSISSSSFETSQMGQPQQQLNNSKKITLHPDEFFRLKQMTFDFIFVDTFGKRFDDAIEVLSNRESLAVTALGGSRNKCQPLSLLLISDFKQIYIFDLFCLGQLRGLKDILASAFICKVVYDGIALFDYILHKYNVKMENVFDLQIVDKEIYRNQGSPEQNERNLSECLTHYFNFPPSLLSAAIEDMTDRQWQERPVIKSNKIKAAQLIVYLLPLRDKLMSLILRPYNDVIQNVYNMKFRTGADCDMLKFKR